jgi:hypothetical protein
MARPRFGVEGAPCQGDVRPERPRLDREADRRQRVADGRVQPRQRRRHRARPQRRDAVAPAHAALEPQFDRLDRHRAQPFGERRQARALDVAEEVQGQMQQLVAHHLRGLRPAPGVAHGRDGRAQRVVGPQRDEQTRDIVGHARMLHDR